MEKFAQTSKEWILENDITSLSTTNEKQENSICDMFLATEATPNHYAVSVVWWTNVFCLPLIAFIGLACNTLNILILTSNTSTKRVPSSNLLLALALCDSCFLIFATVEVTPASISSIIASPLFNHLYIHSVLYIRTFASTFYKTSVLIVVAFNMERYICVCHPLYSHRLCTTRSSRLAITICFGLSLICSTQWPICYYIKECRHSSLEHNFYIVLLNENPTLQIYYRFMDYFSLIGFNILPVITLFLLNIKIIITLHKVINHDLARVNSQITHIESYSVRSLVVQRFNANAMLFVVVLLLLICVGPQIPARLLIEYYGQYHEAAVLYTCVSQQLVFLNASLNFCLYCLVSRKYRSLLQQTIKRLFDKARRYDSSMALRRFNKRSTQQRTTISDDMHISSKKSIQPFSAIPLLRQH